MRRFEIRGYILDMIKKYNTMVYKYTDKLLSKPKDEKVRVNFGSGIWYKPGWQSLDFISSWYGGKILRHFILDHKIDLSKCPVFPFIDKSVDQFFSRMTLEHLDDNAVENIFREVHRCLKDDGYFDFIIPNPALDTDKYYGLDYNPCFCGRHINFFNRQKIKALTKKFGFKQIMFDSSFGCDNYEHYYRLVKDV